MSHLFPEIPKGDQQEKVSPGGSLIEQMPLQTELLNKLLGITEQLHQIQFEMIEVVLVDEMEIVDLNKKYLQREYVTDIITFKYSEESELKSIEGTLFCCLPRIIEQSLEFHATVQHEFARIFVHGLLHLSGFDDDTPEEKEHMTKLENEILHLAGLDL